jgi:hypothetical protein
LALIGEGAFKLTGEYTHRVSKKSHNAWAGEMMRGETFSRRRQAW